MKRSIYQDGGAAEKKVCVECCSSDQVLMRPSQVPEYLRESEFYKSLNTEDDEEFYVPAICMKENMNVETLQDACELLETLRYWGSDALLSPIIKYAMTQPLGTVKSQLSAFVSEFPVLEYLFVVMDSTISDEHRMELAMESGMLDLVQHMEKSVKAFTTDALATAAAYGHAHCLQYALQRPFDEYYMREEQVYRAAVANGYVNCVKLLDQSVLRIGWYHGLDATAASHGQLACLQYMHFSGWSVKNGGFGTSCGGWTLVVRRVCARSVYPVQDKTTACIEAAKRDLLECRKCVRHSGCPLNTRMCDVAVTSGSLQCLKYLHENGCEWDVWTCHTAALKGHLHCLQYAYEHNSPLLLSPPTPRSTMLFNQRFRAQGGPTHLVELVAQRGHWDCVEYLIQQNCPLTRGLTAVCAQAKQDRLLTLAIERGCPVACEVAVRYASTGDLTGLKAAREHDCEWHEDVCKVAAANGHLDCLQYARERGCSWDGRVFWAAESNGYNHIVEYAKLNGCPVRRNINKK